MARPVRRRPDEAGAAVKQIAPERPEQQRPPGPSFSAGPASREPSRKEPPSSQRDFVAAIDRGLRILSAFDEANPRLHLAELIRRTGLPKTTVIRQVRTLIALSYLIYDPAREVYMPGAKCLGLGFSALRALDFIAVASPYLEALAAELGDVAVNLAVRDGIESIYCARFGPPRFASITGGVGVRLPLAESSIGRALLAFLGDGEREALLDRILPTLSDVRANRLRAAIADARKVGFSVNAEEMEAGVAAVAAPIWGTDRERPVAAVNIVALTARRPIADLRELAAHRLLPVARTISQGLGVR